MRTKILLVEDEPLLQSLYRDLLRSRPYLVLTAGEELEALQLIRRERPALILLDLMIPSRAPRMVDYDFHEPVGYEILKSVRRGRSGEERVRVIVLSNLDSDEHRQRAEALGADDYWVKAALNPHDLPARVDAVLAAP